MPKIPWENSQSKSDYNNFFTCPVCGQNYLFQRDILPECKKHLEELTAEYKSKGDDKPATLISHTTSRSTAEDYEDDEEVDEDD